MNGVACSTATPSGDAFFGHSGSLDKSWMYRPTGFTRLKIYCHDPATYGISRGVGASVARAFVTFITGDLVCVMGAGRRWAPLLCAVRG